MFVSLIMAKAGMLNDLTYLPFKFTLWSLEVHHLTRSSSTDPCSLSFLICTVSHPSSFILGTSVS